MASDTGASPFDGRGPLDPADWPDASPVVLGITGFLFSVGLLVLLQSRGVLSGDDISALLDESALALESGGLKAPDARAAHRLLCEMWARNAPFHLRPAKPEGTHGE